MQEIDELLLAISALEEQRPVLGDRVVEAALAPLRERLAALEGRQPITQQRRLVTVLFADIVNSTLMSQGLEPEEVLEIMDGALKRLSVPVDQYGGQVTRYMGDGFLAVFGLSRVHENDARQAVRAGLAVLSESQLYARELERRFRIFGFSTRIGINTGWVAAGGFSEAESTIMGLTVSLAARTEEAAQPDALFITQYTHQHIRGAFDVELLPPIQIKGFPHPINVYKVLGARPRTFRTVTRGVGGIEARLIGREEEFRLLQDRLDRAIRDRQTQLVTIIGEAGVGKSRLLYEFDRRVASAPYRIISFKARSSPQMMAVPFGLLRDMLSYHIGVLTTDPVDVTHHRMAHALSAYIEDEPEMKADFVGALVGFDFSASPYLRGMEENPDQLRERAQLYLTQFLAAVAHKTATVLMLDDIHWSDDLSLSFVTNFIQQYPHLPLCIVCLARPTLTERFPNWGEIEAQPGSGSPESPKLESIRVTLDALSHQDSLKLLSEILGDIQTLPDAVSHQLLANANGNPYYLEEFIQALMDIKAIHKEELGGSWKLDPERLNLLEIPTTLVALLEARLDGLNTVEKSLVQQASVVGQVFWRSALQAVRGDQPIMDETMRFLAKRGFFHLQDTSSIAGTEEYRFHHALLRDVAYQTLPKSERHRYHTQAAAWLIEATQAVRRTGEFAHVIAEHYEIAGANIQAAEWFTESGKRARNQGAPHQALAFFDRALTLLPSVSEPSSEAGDLSLRWEALAGRDEVLSILGDAERRMADDEALVALAESVGDDHLIAEAYYRQGYYLGVTGQYQKEHAAYIHALAAAARAHDQKREAMILGLMVFCEVRLGDLETASQTVITALQCAEELGDDEVLARILTNASVYYAETGDIAYNAQLLERQISINRRIGNIEGEVIGLSNLGYYYIQMGLYTEAKTLLQRCIKMADSIGHRSFKVYGKLNLGLAYLRGGNPNAALEELNQCLPEFEAMNDAVDHASCQTYTAMARESVGQISDALAGYEQAATRLVEIGTLGYAYDAKAGIARCCMGLKNLESARLQASQLWDYLQEGRIGMEFPLLGFETCADIFAATGEIGLAKKAIEAGYKLLIERASKISLPEWRKSFMEQVPEHQRIQKHWSAYSNADHNQKGE